MSDGNKTSQVLFLALLGVIGFAGGLLLVAVVVIILSALGILAV